MCAEIYINLLIVRGYFLYQNWISEAVYWADMRRCANSHKYITCPQGTMWMWQESGGFIVSGLWGSRGSGGGVKTVEHLARCHRANTVFSFWVRARVMGELVTQSLTGCRAPLKNPSWGVFRAELSGGGLVERFLSTLCDFSDVC